MDMLLFVLLLAVTVYAWVRPRRAQRPATPLSRLSGPTTRRRPPEPFLASLAAFLVQCGVSIKSTARAMHTAVMLELQPPARRRSPGMIMSRDDDVVDGDLAYVPPMLEAGNEERGTRNEPGTTTGNEEPEGPKLGAPKYTALRFLTDKGLTDEQVVGVYMGEPAAIMAAMRCNDVEAYQVARAMRGKYKLCLDKVNKIVLSTTAARSAAALEQGEG